MARLTKNTQRHPAASTSAPPSDGPSAAATAPVAPQMPVAVARCASGNSGSSRASEVGTSAAAPAAWTTRAATRTSTVGARPAAAEAARNVSRPAMNIRRRPTRSATRPAGTSSAANTMLYAVRIHDSPASEVSLNDARMSGKAMLTIVTSRKLMKTATDVTARTCHLRCFTQRDPSAVALRDATHAATLATKPMLPRTYDDQNCSVARALEVLGDRWTLLVIRDAFLGVRRFDDFQRNLGVARNVLSDRLQRLVDEGLLERQRYQERPERFEYRLTEKGIDLWPTIITLMKWGDRYYAPPEGAPRHRPPPRLRRRGDGPPDVRPVRRDADGPRGRDASPARARRRRRPPRRSRADRAQRRPLSAPSSSSIERSSWSSDASSTRRIPHERFSQRLISAWLRPSLRRRSATRRWRLSRSSARRSKAAGSRSGSAVGRPPPASRRGR